MKIYIFLMRKIKCPKNSWLLPLRVPQQARYTFRLLYLYKKILGSKENKTLQEYFDEIFHCI